MIGIDTNSKSTTPTPSSGKRNKNQMPSWREDLPSAADQIIFTSHRRGEGKRPIKIKRPISLPRCEPRRTPRDEDLSLAAPRQGSRRVFLHCLNEMQEIRKRETCPLGIQDSVLLQTAHPFHTNLEMCIILPDAGFINGTTPSSSLPLHTN